MAPAGGLTYLALHRPEQLMDQTNGADLEFVAHDGPSIDRSLPGTWFFLTLRSELVNLRSGPMTVSTEALRQGN